MAIGDWIGAGVNLISGLFNRNASQENNAANIAAQQQINAANLAQAREINETNNRQQAKYADLNLAQQKEFAQQGIRWKVDDAIAAGLHPLAALGAQVSSFSPISVGTSSSMADLKAYESKPASLDLGDMGQNISRAISAGSTNGERVHKQAEAVAKIMGGLSLEKASLENDLLRTNIAKERAQLGPPIPIPRPGPERTLGGFAVKDDDLKQKEEDHPQTKIVRPFGYPLRANPFFNDGQQFEDRYGESEIGSTFKFGLNTIADHIYTGYGMLPDSWKNNPSTTSSHSERWKRLHR